MPEERIRVDPESGDWTCVCGNEAHLDGFWPCEETEGIGDRHAGYRVVTSPDSTWGYLFVCGRCLRLLQYGPSVSDPGEVDVIGVMDRRDFDATIDGAY
jgi:hypothetical protein